MNSEGFDGGQKEIVYTFVHLKNQRMEDDRTTLKDYEVTCGAKAQMNEPTDPFFEVACAQARNPNRIPLTGPGPSPMLPSPHSLSYRPHPLTLSSSLDHPIHRRQKRRSPRRTETLTTSPLCSNAQEKSWFVLPKTRRTRTSRQTNLFSTLALILSPSSPPFTLTPRSQSIGHAKDMASHSMLDFCQNEFGVFSSSEVGPSPRAIVSSLVNPFPSSSTSSKPPL